MEWKDHIELNPAIQAGKPIIKGTRLTVDFVVELLANDWSEKAIRQEYPTLTHESIQACLAYACDALRRERVFPLSA